jgi:hypothetical protein
LPPYSYQWNTGETTAFIENLPPGVYNVVVTDANGCTADQTGIVNAFGCPELSIEAAIQNVSCNGACDGNISIVDIINGSGDYTYNWNNGSTLQTQTNLCAGLYEVTITDNTGCIVIGMYEITQPDTLIVTPGSTNESLLNLNDGTAWVIPSGGTAPYAYAWSNGSTDSLIINLIAGVYTVTVTDDHGCTATAEATVAAGLCSVIQSELVDATCFLACNGSIILSVINNSPPITYGWSNGSTTSLITDLCAGDFTVTVTDANGCSVVETYTVHEPAELQTNAASTDETESFNDGTAWATPTGGTAPYMYVWSNGSTDSLVINLIPGEYSVTVTDAHNCEASATIYVDEFCSGHVIVNAINYGCLDTCLWAVSDVGFINVEEPYTVQWNTGDTTIFIENLCPGLYILTVTEQETQCMYRDSFTIGYPNPIILEVDTVINNTDFGSGSISISVIGGPPPPYHFYWYDSNGFTSEEEDPTGLSGGYYTVLVLDSLQNCGEIDSIEVLDLVDVEPIEGHNLQFFPNPAYDKVLIKGLETNEYRSTCWMLRA